MKVSSEPGALMIFFREGHFYPIQGAVGRPLVEQAAEHAKRNPGTLRVEDVNGVVLWVSQVPDEKAIEAVAKSKYDVLERPGRDPHPNPPWEEVDEECKEAWRENARSFILLYLEVLSSNAAK